MRFNEFYKQIKEAKMGMGVISTTVPRFDVTCGFEVEVAVSENILHDFDYEEYFANMGIDIDEDSIRADVEQEYSVYDFVDFNDYVSVNNLNSGYRVATVQEIENVRSEYENIMDDYFFIVDEDDGEIIGVDITDLSEIESYFSDAYEEIQEAYNEKIQEKIQEKISDKIADHKSDVDMDYIIGNHVYEQVGSVVEFGVNLEDDYHGSDKDTNAYTIEPDSSISPSGSEIVSPVFNDLDEMFEDLEKIFDMIMDDGYMKTNNSTGLHINIGGFDAKKLDRLKLVMFLGETKISSDFGRQLNTMAEQIIPRVSRFIDNLSITINTYDDFVDKINGYIDTNLKKYYSVNFEKLDQGYIEFRGIGGDGYEHSFDEIKLHVLRMVRAINIALDKNAYRNEYMKKVSKLVGNPMTSPKPVGKSTPHELIAAKKLLSQMYRFTNYDNLENHDNMAYLTARAMIEYFDRNNEVLDFLDENKSFIQYKNVYNNLKRLNLPSSDRIGMSMDDTKKMMKDLSFKFHPNVLKRLLQLFS